MTLVIVTKSCTTSKRARRVRVAKEHPAAPLA